MIQVEEKARSARRSELTRVAARLFSERGYHGTSMQHLAEALGLQRGSLYAHIGSKEELLLDVVEEGAARFLERASDAAEGAAAGRPVATPSATYLAIVAPWPMDSSSGWACTSRSRRSGVSVMLASLVSASDAPASR